MGKQGPLPYVGTYFSQFPPVTYDIAIAKRLGSLALIFVGMITFNNLALKYVEVSFYNVARSLTIVFNVVLTYYMLGETTSAQTLGTLGVVIVGFFMGSAGEVHFSFIGAAFGLFSSLFVALNGIFTKTGMKIVDGNSWRLQFYNNLNASFLFLPLIVLSGELTTISANVRLFFSPYFWFVMVLGGVFGFLIGIVTILQISVTSPLTHNISGTAKACVQTILALYIWGNPTTAANLLGTALVLFGSAAYTYVRSNEMDAAKNAKAAVQVERAVLPPSSKTTTDEAHGEDSEKGLLIGMAAVSANKRASGSR